MPQLHNSVPVSLLIPGLLFASMTTLRYNILKRIGGTSHESLNLH